MAYEYGPGLTPNYMQPLGGVFGNIDPASWTLFNNPITQGIGNALQPISQMFNAPTNPFDLAMSSMNGNLTPTSIATRAQMDELRGKLEATGMMPGEIQSILNSVRSEGNRGGINDISAAYEQLKQAQLRQEQLGEIDRYQKEYGGYLDSQKERLGRIVGDTYAGIKADPNAIRNDYEYGSTLAALENRIQGANRQAQSDIAATQARSGGGALSGIANRRALAAESDKNLGLQSALSGMKGAASGQLGSAYQQGYDLQNYAGQARNAIKAGSPISNLDYQFSLPSAIQQQRFGQSQIIPDKTLNGILAMMGLGQNALNSSISNIGSVAGLLMPRK